MKKINLLPIDEGTSVEWSTAWVSNLIKVFRDNDKLNDLLEYLDNSSQTINVSPQLGNEIKQLIKAKNLDKLSQNARIILLSAAHCFHWKPIEPNSIITRESYASFENMSKTKDIHLFFEWDTGGTSRTVIKPGTIAEITFNANKAVICHRSDGGDYMHCPNKNVVAQADDYFQLEENGGYSN